MRRKTCTTLTVIYAGILVTNQRERRTRKEEKEREEKKGKEDVNTKLSPTGTYGGYFPAGKFRPHEEVKADSAWDRTR